MELATLLNNLSGNLTPVAAVGLVLGGLIGFGLGSTQLSTLRQLAESDPDRERIVEWRQAGRRLGCTSLVLILAIAAGGLVWGWSGFAVSVWTFGCYMMGGVNRKPRSWILAPLLIVLAIAALVLPNPA